MTRLAYAQRETASEVASIAATLAQHSAMQAKLLELQNTVVQSVNTTLYHSIVQSDLQSKKALMISATGSSSSRVAF